MSGRCAGRPGSGRDAVSGRAEVDDCRAVGDVGDDLEPGPQARVTRQGHGVEAEAHDVGDGAWASSGRLRLFAMVDDELGRVDDLAVGRRR